MALERDEIRQEIARAAVSLASHALYYVTGMAIPVDGGSTSFSQPV